MTGPRRHIAFVVVACGALSMLAGCTGGRALEAYPTATGGDAHRGKTAAEQFRCGSCHEIPGISGANGLVGPSLARFARRSFIGGEAPNTPANLVKWIISPQSIEPATAMPALGLNEQQARDTAAYLYTLR